MADRELTGVPGDQVHTADGDGDDEGVGEETQEVGLFSEDEIPWEEIAFQSGTFALRKYFEDRGKNRGVHVHELRRSRS